MIKQTPNRDWPGERGLRNSFNGFRNMKTTVSTPRSTSINPLIHQSTNPPSPPASINPLIHQSINPSIRYTPLQRGAHPPIR